MNHTSIKIGIVLLVILSNSIIEGYPYAKQRSRLYMCSNDITVLINTHVNNMAIKNFINDSTKQAFLKQFQEASCTQKANKL